MGASATGIGVRYPLGRHCVWHGIEWAERTWMASHERAYHTNNLHADTLKWESVMWSGLVGICTWVGCDFISSSV